MTEITESLSSALESINVPGEADGDDLPISPAVKKINSFINDLDKTRVAIYDVKELIRLQGRFPDGIPQTLDFGLAPSEKKRLAIVKKVLASPRFIPALRSCQEASRLNLKLHKLSGLVTETLHQLILDMEAIDADLVPPTYALGDSHRQHLEQMFAESLHWPTDEPTTLCRQTPDARADTSTTAIHSWPTAPRNDTLNPRPSPQSPRIKHSSPRTSTSHDDASNPHGLRQQRHTFPTSHTSRSNDEVSDSGTSHQEPGQRPTSSQSRLTSASVHDNFKVRAPRQEETIVPGPFIAFDESSQSKPFEFPPLPSSSPSHGDASKYSSSSPSPSRSRYSANPSTTSIAPYHSDSEDSQGSILSPSIMPSFQSLPGEFPDEYSDRWSNIPPRLCYHPPSPPFSPVRPQSGRTKTKRLRKFYFKKHQQLKAQRAYREAKQLHHQAAEQHLADPTGPSASYDRKNSPISRSVLRIRKRNAAREARKVRFADSAISPKPRSRTVSEALLHDHSPNLSPPSTPPLVQIRYRGPQAPADLDAAKARIDKIFNEPSALLISHDSGFAIQAEKEREAREAEEAARKAAEEARAAEEAARKAAEEQAARELQERLQRTHGLRLPEKPLVEPLSADWIERAQSTLHATPTTALATTSEGIELRRHDFAKVVPATEWLNDEIVNGSLAWLDRAINSAAGIKNTRANTRKCLALNSFFWKQLAERGAERTQRALRRNHVDKNNFLDVDTILLPVCENLHWTLMVVRPTQRTISHMDSLNPRGSANNTNLALTWVKHILEDKFIAEEWNVVRHEAPRQTNGWDCGVHTITNAMCVALGLNPVDCYRSTDMPLQRIRIACMLLNQGFTDDFDLRVY